MAIEKGSKILASEVASKNNTLKTINSNGQPKSTAKNDSQDWWYEGKWFQSTRSWNLKWSFESASSAQNEQYAWMFFDNAAHENLIFLWKGDQNAPSINTQGWSFVYDVEPGDVQIRYLQLPKGTQVWFKIDYDDEPFLSRPNRWYLEGYQAQNGISTGEHIRVWDEEWSALLPVGGTQITADLANRGKLGAG